MRKIASLFVFILMLSLGAFAGKCDCSKCRADQVCCNTANGYCGCFPGGISCARLHNFSFNIDEKLVSDGPVLLAQKCKAGEPGCADMKVPPPPVQEPVKKSTEPYHAPVTYPPPDNKVYHTHSAPPPDPCPGAAGCKK